MSEAIPFKPMPISTRREITAWVPALKALAENLQAGYLANDPGCKSLPWSQVRTARNYLWTAAALLNGVLEAAKEADNPKI